MEPGAIMQVQRLERNAMCGIVGYWGYSAQDVDDATFEAFTHSLAHRGPDGFGIEHDVEARLRLGHRRLAILDLSELGHQPLSYANGRFCAGFSDAELMV